MSTPAPLVRFLDLSVTDEEERRDILAGIEAMMDHGRIVMGPEVAQFEAAAAAYCGRKHAIGVNTGTDALILGLKALDIGVGDEVITTPLSWLATGSSILLNGATAVFGDVDEGLNLTPSSIEPLITPRTKAILVVHFTGNLAAMDEICAIARRHGLLVVEDGAQAFGATLGTKTCGGFGDLACISMNAMKTLGALGDAGIVLTDDDRVRQRVDQLRHSGVEDREWYRELSHNCRLDTIQAAVLLKRLPRYGRVMERRRANAARYDAELAGFVSTPPRRPDHAGAFYTYPILTDRRDELQAFLTAQGIETRVQHPVLMNHQPAFQGRIRGESPRATELVKRILCLPIHEKLTDDQQSFVIVAVKGFFGASA